MFQQQLLSAVCTARTAMPVAMVTVHLIVVVLRLSPLLFFSSFSFSFSSSAAAAVAVAADEEPGRGTACRRLKDTVHIAQTISATIAAESSSPFEFRVLEALLAETAHHFESKSRYFCILSVKLAQPFSGGFAQQFLGRICISSCLLVTCCLRQQTFSPLTSPLYNNLPPARAA